jgi:hypothetical protein
MKNHPIEDLIDKTLNSVDGVSRATPKPFLFTRLTARMHAVRSNEWEVIGRFIVRPSVLIAGISAIIIINTMVLIFHNSSDNTMPNYQTGVTDDYNSSMATLYNIEN